MTTRKTCRSSRFALFLLSLLVLLLNTTNALYEDQIKKFDWRSLQIGALTQAHLELNTFQPRLLVSTRENVIAALCPKTGEVLWRQILETGARGDIKLLQLYGVGADESSSTAAARANSHHGYDLLSVQGHAPALVRGWNANIGTLELEWSLLPLQAEQAKSAFWFISHSILYHVLPIWGSHLEVTQYFASSGQATGLTGKITATWLQPNNCIQTGVYYACLDNLQLISLDLTAAQPQIHKQTLQSVPAQKFEALKGANGVLVVDHTLVSISNDIKTCQNLRSASFLAGNFNQRRAIITADVERDSLLIKAYYADSCEPIAELTQQLTYPEHYGKPSLITFDCKLKRNNDGKSCLFVLSTEDEAILTVQQSKFRWTREEALANVVATEFIDLPLADTEGALENEMKDTKNADILSAFLRRITAQLLQIKSIFLHVIGLGPKPTASQRAGLVRDSFGLHKMLVVLTRSGKIFGIDNINGKHHWKHYFANGDSFANNENMRLLVQRTTKHFPLQPICTIVARDKLSGNGVLYSFDPINGQATPNGLRQLNYKIKQLALLAETETSFLKGILLLDHNNRVEVHPAEARKSALNMHIFVADKKRAYLEGFVVQQQQQELVAKLTWNARLGGVDETHEIIAVAAKNPIERVHSQGRVLGDRSVLYKYINPNLVAIVTQAADSIHKVVLNTHLIDVVSGAIIFSMQHRKACGPIQIVHSENWIAYAYYNDKVRRTEIATIELYEGKTQANSTHFSSMKAPPFPLIERQSYIVPTIVESMRETITERGITNKHVLIGTSSGAIIEMPWILLDPRRPLTSTSNGREEGAIPYVPELPLPTESIINYNQSIARLKNIYTAPSGLESTCLVVATGLDIFVTRVAPSKTFDLLKEDFDYILIATVLIALTSGCLIVKHLAAKKLLKQAWK